MANVWVSACGLFASLFPACKYHPRIRAFNSVLFSVQYSCLPMAVSPECCDHMMCLYWNHERTMLPGICTYYLAKQSTSGSQFNIPVNFVSQLLSDRVHTAMSALFSCNPARLRSPCTLNHAARNLSTPKREVTVPNYSAFYTQSRLNRCTQSLASCHQVISGSNWQGVLRCSTPGRGSSPLTVDMCTTWLPAWPKLK